MKLNLSYLILLSISLISCKQKTPQQVRQERIEASTDAELMNDIYNKPINFKVESSYVIKENKEFPNTQAIQPVLKDGSVIQLTFQKSSVYVQGFNYLNGNYEQGYYASANGNIRLEFYKPRGTYASVDTRTEKLHPSEQATYIHIIESLEEKYYSLRNKVTITYNLKMLDAI